MRIRIRGGSPARHENREARHAPAMLRPPPLRVALHAAIVTVGANVGYENPIRESMVTCKAVSIISDKNLVRARTHAGSDDGASREARPSLGRTTFTRRLDRHPPDSWGGASASTPAFGCRKTSDTPRRARLIGASALFVSLAAPLSPACGRGPLERGATNMRDGSLPQSLDPLRPHEPTQMNAIRPRRPSRHHRASPPGRAYNRTKHLPELALPVRRFLQGPPAQPVEC